jgi:zinc protease
MSPVKLVVLTVLAWLVGTPLLAQELITVPGESPLIDITVQFETGSVDDPSDRYGLAYLTAHALSEGSSSEHSYQEFLEVFYPWAVSVNTTVGKEMVTYSTTVHKDHLELFTPLLVEMLSRPKFEQSDLDRLRDKAKNYLTQDLRVNNDEELGKEVLYLQIYPKSHPYGHHNAGTVSGLEAIQSSDLREFYGQQFRPERLVVGVAGGYPDGYPERLLQSLVRQLPEGDKVAVVEPRLSKPAAPTGRRVTIVDKDTRSVAMSLGFPIEVNRSHPDWAALFLFRSFLGEHRSSNSHLYQRLREARGLNYGDYAYIEYFPNGMSLTKPEPYYPRKHQIFQIWIRPVEPETALFTLRATFYELEKILRDGLSQEQFEATRSFLTKNAPLLVDSSSRHLGYTLDGRFYQADPFVDRLRADLAALTLDQVNEIVRRHIQAKDMEIVLISKNGEALRKALLDGAPSPMTYNSEKSKDILEEDRVIQTYPLNLDEVTVVPVNSFFR